MSTVSIFSFLTFSKETSTSQNVKIFRSWFWWVPTFPLTPHFTFPDWLLLLLLLKNNRALRVLVAPFNPYVSWDIIAIAAFRALLLYCLCCVFCRSVDMALNYQDHRTHCVQYVALEMTYWKLCIHLMKYASFSLHFLLPLGNTT